VTQFSALPVFMKSCCPKTVNIFGHQVCCRNEPSRRTVGTSDGNREEILKLRGRTRIPVAFKDVGEHFVSP